MNPGAELRRGEQHRHGAAPRVAHERHPRARTCRRKFLSAIADRRRAGAMMVVDPQPVNRESFGKTRATSPTERTAFS
jgi:hypothetical protein